MATGRWLSLLFSAAFSALLTPCCGQQFQQIDLTAPNITCNMSSIYNGTESRSLDCHGAINGNSRTTWIPTGNPGANCLYTARGDMSPSWQVDMGQPRNIHRIIIYTPADGRNYIEAATVSIDGRSIYTFCPGPNCVKNPNTIADKLPVKGQVIKLTRTGEEYLTMCELQVEGCSLNMYGESCTRPCSSQCEENGGATTCDSITGYCFACIPGRYGDQCDQQCSEHCLQSCNQTSGDCTLGCQSGWWGDKCDSQCSAKCDGPCERDNGDKCHRCINHFAPPQCIACLPGYYGDQCDQQCSEHCLPDNSGNKTCNQNNGHCPAGCESGWWGDKCDTECSAQCVGSCDAGDGHCSRCNGHFAPPLCTACVSGYYGDQCDQVCSEHCLPDNGKITCGQNNGHCTSGCRSGFYGTQCEAQCGYGCITNTCDRQNGACSCDALWSPPKCAECRDGYYGAETCRPCGHCSNNTVCDNNDGHCPDGCDDGYGGDLCDVKATGNSDTQDGASIVGPIVGSVLGAALLIGLFILLAALIIRRRRSREVPSPAYPSERRAEVQFPTDNAMLSVDAQENKPETSDPESNYAPLENYENPDDIRPYSMLQTDRGHSANINIQGDEEAVLYHNTGTTGDKTYVNVIKK